MILNSNLSKQKEAFCLIRNTEMNDDEFLLLLIIYPSFLAALSDDDIDDDEEDLIISYLYNFLFEIYGSELSEDEYENMISSYLEDFYWISENKEWEKKTLSSLRSLYKEVEGLKDKVAEMVNEISEFTKSDNLEESVLVSFLLDDDWGEDELF